MSDSRDKNEVLKANLTAGDLVEKLRLALQKDGDFPASAKIVNELRQLTSDPKTTANQITEVILREPSLGTRILHLVNSSFYRRAKSIMTVSQAVIQIGMKPLAELCAGLILLQKFVPAARQGGSFANCLRKTVLTSLLSSSIIVENASSGTSNQSNKNDEYGFLAGSFYELGTLLLAFYFPQIYETAVRRAESKKQEVGQSILDLTGLSPVQLSLEVLEALELPEFYQDILRSTQESEIKLSTGTTTLGAPKNDAERIGHALSAAKKISEAVSSGKTKQDLDEVLREIKEIFNYEAKSLNRVVSELPQLFRDHCASIDLQLPALPEFVMSYTKSPNKSEPSVSTTANESGPGFTHFVSEIRQAVENREPTASIITSVMETLAWSLHFDRVLLLLVTGNKTKLMGRLLLGNTSNIDPKDIVRSLKEGQEFSGPDLEAYRQARPIFDGDPVLSGGWPLVALPIGFGQRAIGVIYADRATKSGGEEQSSELNSQEQAATGILAELLDRSVSLQG